MATYKSEGRRKSGIWVGRCESNSKRWYVSQADSRGLECSEHGSYDFPSRKAAHAFARSVERAGESLESEFASLLYGSLS